MVNIEKFLNRNFYLFILLLPFVEFWSGNVFEFDKNILIYYIVFSLFSILLIFFFIRALSFFFDSNVGLYFSFFFYLIFKYILIKSFIGNLNLLNKFDGEISLIIILIFFMLMIKITKYLKTELISKFTIIYLFLLFSISFSKIILLNKNDLYRLNDTSFLKKHDFLKIQNPQNIYYVVLDGMTSLESFENFYKYKLKNFREFIDNENIFYSQGHTAYPNTLYNFTSFLNLDYIIDEKSDPFLDRSSMYPYTMRKHLLKNYNLAKILKKINLEFKWESATHPGNCYNYNLELCLDKSKASKIQYMRDNFYVIDAFLSSTPIFSITTRLGIYNPYDKLYDAHKFHDSIGNFLENVKKVDLENKKFFFLIHHMAPHNPFVFNKDCSKRRVNNLLNDADLDGYESSYLCALKKIIKLYTFVKKNDPNSIVIFQGDHGWNFNHDNRNALKIEYYNPYTFNMIISGNQCDTEKIINKLNMINTVRFALSCSVNKPIDLVDTKKFFTYQRDEPNYGKVFELK